MARHLRIARGPGVRKVTVPDLSSLTKSESESLLTSLGLTYSSSSSNTENSNLNNSIKTQSVASQSVVNIGSSVSFEYYTYVATPPPIISTPPPIIAVTPPIIAVTPPIIAVTPPIIALGTVYYASGCCGGTVVQGSSNVSFANALDNMDSFCPAGATNVLTSNSGYPSQNCVATPPPIIATPPPIIATPPPIIATPPPIIATPPPIIATPPPIIATPPPIIATPPPIIATPPPIIATPPPCIEYTCTSANVRNGLCGPTGCTGGTGGCCMY